MIFDILKLSPRFFYWKVIDTWNYYKNKEWLIFKGFGLHIYVGMFGTGKTSSMVHDAFVIACRYSQVKILTNMKLQNFPRHTKIIPLIHYRQISDCEPNTLILIDEISSIFNSRNWKNEGVPAPLLSTLLQVRKENKMLYATAQRFGHVDALFRQITFTVRECSCWYERWNWVSIFDGYDYENSNAMKMAVEQERYSFIQSNFVRSLYDTKELIEKMKKEEYLPDSEILEKQGSTTNIISILANGEEGKKKKPGLFGKKEKSAR